MDLGPRTSRTLDLEKRPEFDMDLGPRTSRMPFLFKFPFLVAILVTSFCLAAFLVTHERNITTNLHPESTMKTKDTIGLYIDENLLFTSNVSMEDPTLIEYLRRTILKPSKEKLVLGGIPPNKDWSQQDESPTVDSMLKAKRNGFVVECGAADGETYSNSLFFEVERNWTGLLIEANDGMFRTLKTKHRHMFAYNGCLSPVKYPTLLSFKGISYLGGLTSFYEKSRMSSMVAVRKNSDDVQVKCVPFLSLILALNIKRIDFFSLDVEGSELDILKTIPFDKIFIDVIAVEFGIWKGTKEEMQKKLDDFRVFFRNVGGYSEGKVHKGDVYFQKLTQRK